jgi:hypothetical protein
MGLFDKIRPAYVTAPVEPPVPDEVRIAEIDIKLRSISVIPAASGARAGLAGRPAARPAQRHPPREAAPGPGRPGLRRLDHRQLRGEPVVIQAPPAVALSIDDATDRRRTARLDLIAGFRVASRG